jgi:hypothetical protein
MTVAPQHLIAVDFGRRPLNPGRSLALGRHPKHFPIQDIRGFPTKVLG